VSSDDADKTTALVTQAGGSRLVPAMDVSDLGRMAVFADPQGAVFGVWQPGSHTGSELVGEVGAQTWFELTAQTPADAPAFYSSVFGWEAGGSDSYVEFTLGGTSVAGCTDPSQGTSGWVPYFGCADPAAAAEQAEALGGSILLPHTSFGGGSCVILRDPHGAVFGLVTPVG
jgi:predicted enzyme related to lactoylglutathione lyase